MVWIRKLFWFVMFLIATFCFYVVFEHGTQDFVKNARVEFAQLKKTYGTKLEKAKDQSDKPD